MLYSFNGKHPHVDQSVFIAPGAKVIGDVTIGKQSSVWFNAVLRGDEGPIRIGARTNIQDNTTCHLYEDYPLLIEDDVTVGHNAILHGCTIGSGSLIGMASAILDGAEIGESCFIAAGTLIPPGKRIPPRSFVMGTPGKVIREVTEKDLQILRESAEVYVAKAEQFRTEPWRKF